MSVIEYRHFIKLISVSAEIGNDMYYRTNIVTAQLPFTGLRKKVGNRTLSRFHFLCFD